MSDQSIRVIATEDAIFIDGVMVMEVTGGPDDPVLMSGTEISREDLERYQQFILNFMNTGFFNQEV